MNWQQVVEEYIGTQLTLMELIEQIISHNLQVKVLQLQWHKQEVLQFTLVIQMHSNIGQQLQEHLQVLQVMDLCLVQELAFHQLQDSQVLLFWYNQQQQIGQLDYLFISV